ncbi:rod shape-determining protein RodA [Sphingorhabdus lutea]|uniref:Peptidoglycan glycosyltransferase MrdB n=1 Tax=Sphingorhabdus lutea TaxID=1913578 RepID=A0A1L3J9A5_9SPHN|nr:rod shape-determining protein RodA [Sphingorhabdus lutea]APG61716.1 rod shape-determining protein RodA [Sphingorhabdus lutea]
MSVIPDKIAALPWRIIFLLLIMVSFGTTVLYSAAGGNMQPWAAKHMIRFLILLAMAIVMSRFSLDFYKAITFPVYGAILLLLMGVEILGFVGGGSQRWIDLGFMMLQPSELMKPAIVLAIASFFDRLPPSKIGTFDAVWPVMMLIGVPAAFVLLQPDLGTSLAIIAGAIVVGFVAGWPLKWFITAGISAIFLIPLAFFFGLEEYQQKRVTTFLNPEADPLGSGYHVNQSQIAIGSGGLFGKGFLNGTQSHLDYLPEGHTDFVFATMAEEWGMIGGLAVIFGFFLLLKWGTNVGLNCKSRFGQLTAVGLTFVIFFYAGVNLMMVMGFAPVVGIPLPFLSHGGSSMMTIMICIGIIMAIERNPGGRNSTFS